MKHLIALALISAILASLSEPGFSDTWWKGNLHTHSYWSDGDDFPEMIADWYKQNGYHFLALSDHNVLSIGERWADVAQIPQGETALPTYLERFGDDWVETRMEDGRQLVRLKPLNEFRALLEEPGRFLMIQAEEVTDNFTLRRPVRSLPVHLNATNLIEYIMPRGGDSVREVLQNNIDALHEQREATGQPMMIHINHPNFGWAITAEDIMALDGNRFFEVFNGHPSVRNYGNELRAGLERVWDIVLTKRIAELGKEVLYGLATDDSHNYHDIRTGQSNSGRGWVMVRAEYLTPESIVLALERGDFYSSSGVTLESLTVTDSSLSFEIAAEEGVEYTTQFIGTREGYDPESEVIEDPDAPFIPVTRRYSDSIGEVLSEVTGRSATYTFTGDEYYVRATIVSSKPMENPYQAGDMESAWIQPVVLK